MDDIVPGLLEVITQQFDEKTYNSKKLKKALKNLQAKKATYKDVNEFAIEIGEILADVLQVNITAEILPDGKMYFNIADRILNPTLQKNFDLISGYATDVQTQLNHDAGLHLKAQAPDFNQDRVDGFINRISSEDDFDSIKWILDDPIVNFCQNVVDDTIRANAEFHAKVGLTPKITRIVSGHKPCKWCKDLAGSYDYNGFDMPDDIFRRHDNCRCIVEYLPGDGKRQDVWSKAWHDPQRDTKIKTRKEIGLRKTEEKVIKKNVKVDKNNDAIYESKLKISEKRNNETKIERMRRELAEAKAENQAIKKVLIQDYMRMRGMTLEEATKAANEISEKARKVWKNKQK